MPVEPLKELRRIAVLAKILVDRRDFVEDMKSGFLKGIGANHFHVFRPDFPELFERRRINRAEAHPGAEGKGEPYPVKRAIIFQGIGMKPDVLGQGIFVAPRGCVRFSLRDDLLRFGFFRRFPTAGRAGVSLWKAEKRQEEQSNAFGKVHGTKTAIQRTRGKGRMIGHIRCPGRRPYNVERITGPGPECRCRRARSVLTGFPSSRG